MKEKEHKFEFGRYDWKNGSVEITIEFPDPLHLPPPGSQEEWEKQRKWYLKYAGSSLPTVMRGMAEGYLIDWNYQGEDGDWMQFSSMQDQLTDFDYDTGAYKYRNYYVHCDDEWEEQPETRRSKKEATKLNTLLQKRRHVTNRLIVHAKKLRNNILERNLWTSQQFREIGFRLPRFSNSAEEDLYILRTLDKFVNAVAKRTRSVPKGMLRNLIRDSNLDPSLIKEAKDNPWKVYEELKQGYCLKADSLKEYDRRIDEVAFALRL